MDCGTVRVDKMGGKSSVLETISSHTKALGPDYPGAGAVKKFQFDKKYIPWSVDFPGYQPVDYTDPKVLAGPAWADPDIRTKKDVKLSFNKVDGKTDRGSFTGAYSVDKNGLPLNPMGRTGMTGRGLLGKWGPNHAADPIVTRWVVDAEKKKVKKAGKPVLEFVSILRSLDKEWAIPGGMVDPGEEVSITLKREFGEEAFNSEEATEEERQEIEKSIASLFKHGHTVYKGYVDDPRNTDNAWMETVAVNFHDHDGVTKRFRFKSGSDAAGVQWIAIDKKLNLYASHIEFVKETCKHHDAYFEE